MAADLGRWRMAKAGLKLILISMIALVLNVVVASLLVTSLDLVLGWIRVGLLTCVSPVLALAAFIGLCLCCTAPYPPARNRAAISVLFILSPFAIAAAVSIIGVNAPVDRVQDNLTLDDGNVQSSLLLTMVVLFFAAIGATVYWCFFHVAVADCFQDGFLRKFANLTIILCVCLVIAAILYVFVSFVMGATGARQLLVFPILAISLFSMIAALCIQAIRTINRGTAAPS